jgi:hypothetical protein
MLQPADQNMMLKRIDTLGRELERLRRDLLHAQVVSSQLLPEKPSLFGSVQGGDVTPEMIEESKQALFRPLEDI